MSDEAHTGQFMLCISFRVEGDYWNAYMTRNGDMSDAALLGSLGFGIVQKMPDVAEAFKALMISIVNNSVQALSDAKIEYVVEVPAGGRTGNA